MLSESRVGTSALVWQLDIGATRTRSRNFPRETERLPRESFNYVCETERPSEGKSFRELQTLRVRLRVRVALTHTICVNSSLNYPILSYPSLQVRADHDNLGGTN